VGNSTVGPKDGKSNDRGGDRKFDKRGPGGPRKPGGRDGERREPRK